VNTDLVSLVRTSPGCSMHLGDVFLYLRHADWPGGVGDVVEELTSGLADHTGTGFS